VLTRDIAAFLPGRAPIDYRLTIDYGETPFAVPIFESMKAKLAGTGVSRLRGADI